MMEEDYNEQKHEAIKEQIDNSIKISNMYKQVFSNGHGIDVLKHLEETFNKHPSYLPGWNLNDTCYFEGHKSVINYIKRQIENKDAN